MYILNNNYKLEFKRIHCVWSTDYNYGNISIQLYYIRVKTHVSHVIQHLSRASSFP
jgi:hypothetical protein